MLEEDSLGGFGTHTLAAFLRQDAKSKLREIAEKRAEDVEEVMVHLEKTLACLGPGCSERHVFQRLVIWSAL